MKIKFINIIAISIILILAIQNKIQAQSVWTKISIEANCNAIISTKLGYLFAFNSGIVRSTDNGATWQTLATPFATMTSPINIIANKNGDIYVGTWSGYGTYRSTNNGDSWEKINESMGNVVDISFRDNGTMIALTASKGIFRSTDNGATWTNVFFYYWGVWTNQLCVAKDGKFYALIQDTIRCSSDDGITWDNIYVGISGNIEISPSGDFYVTSGGGIYRSIDNGKNWTLRNFNVGHETINSMSFDSSGNIFVSSRLLGGVFRSYNKGESWGKVNQGLPVSSVWNTHFSNNVLYASTSFGIYKRNEFISWSPLPPNTVMPLNNSIKNLTDITFSWNPSAGTDSYRLQISKDSIYNQIVIDLPETIGTSKSILNLDKATTYYWRVNAANKEGISDWSTSSKFTTVYPQIEIPKPESPQQGETSVSFIPTLSWHRVPLVSGYEIQIANDPSFSIIVYSKSTTVDTVVTSDSLQPSTNYFWHVRALRLDTASQWSETYDFITRRTLNVEWSEDFFPLYVGRSWLYNYQTSTTEYYTNTIEYGTATDSIISKATRNDTTFWSVCEIRNITHEVRWTVTTTSKDPIIDTAFFTIIESLSGNHRLLAVGVPDGGRLLGSHRTVFLLTAEFSDSSTFFRYFPTEKQNVLKFTKGNGYMQGMSATFQRSIGAADISYFFSAPHIGYGVHHTLKDFFVTSVSKPKEIQILRTAMLLQNYPNPFNPTTNISFNIPTESMVILKIFDLVGREVTTLASKVMSAGSYTRLWNAVNIPSGIYFYRLQAGSFVETKKLVLLK